MVKRLALLFGGLLWVALASVAHAEDGSYERQGDARYPGGKQQVDSQFQKDVGSRRVIEGNTFTQEHRHFSMRNVDLFDPGTPLKTPYRSTARSTFGSKPDGPTTQSFSLLKQHNSQNSVSVRLAPG